MVEPLSRKDNGQIKHEEGLFFIIWEFCRCSQEASDIRWGYAELDIPENSSSSHVGGFASWISMLAQCFESKSELWSVPVIR